MPAIQPLNKEVRKEGGITAGEDDEDDEEEDIIYNI